MAKTPPNLWDRRPGETARPYAAARVYFELGAQRSIYLAAQKVSKSVPVLKRWSRRFQWVKRANAYDRWRDQINQAAAEAQAKEIAARWASREEKRREQLYLASEKLIAKVLQMVEFPLATVETKDGSKIVKPAKWNMGMAARLLQVGQQVSGAAIRNEGAVFSVNEEVDEIEFVDYKPAGKK